MKFTVKPRRAGGGFLLESEALSHGRLWYDKPGDAVDYAIHCAGAKPATIELFDRAGKAIAKINHDPREKEHGGRLGKI